MIRQIDGEKNDGHTDSQKLIIVYCSEEYLLGALKGFCHSNDCKYLQLSSVNVRDLIEQVKINEPAIIFINLIYAEETFNSPYWQKMQALLQDRNIPLVGLGNIESVHNAAFRSYFAKTFQEPLDIDEVLEFVRNTINVTIDRRISDRRVGFDRRKRHLPGFVRRAALDIRVPEPPVVCDAAVGDLYINYETMTISLNDRHIEVSPKEFKLIDFLVKNKGRVVSPDNIIRVIWPENARATKADVHQYIYMLRHKLEKDPGNPQLLLTVKGFGYKLCA